MKKKRILLTGSSGICGSAISDSLLIERYDFLFLDIADPVPRQDEHSYYKTDLSKADEIEKVFIDNDIDIVIHLGGSSDRDSSWDAVLNNNIIGTYNLMDLSVRYGVKRVIFASTNHVVGMYEEDDKDTSFGSLLLDPDKKMVDRHSESRPDSLYGVSKLFGENLCRYYTEKFDIDCYILRIGSVREKSGDHPYNYAEAGVRRGDYVRGDENYTEQELRLKSIWMSRDDFTRMIAKLIEYESAERFDVFYAISKNDRRSFDIEYAEKKLDFDLQDNAEKMIWKSEYGLNNNQD